MLRHCDGQLHSMSFSCSSSSSSEEPDGCGNVWRPVLLVPHHFGVGERLAADLNAMQEDEDFVDLPEAHDGAKNGRAKATETQKNRGS